MRGSSSRRILTIVVAVVAVAVVVFLAIALISPDSWPGEVLRGTAIMSGGAEPTYGTMIVNGDYGEWDLAQDFFADMYRAADPTKDILAKLYLRYDCDSNTLGVLVMAEPGHSIDVDAGADEHFIKVNDTKVIDANYTPPDGAPPPDFAWIGLSADGSTAAGWEASIAMYPGSYDLNVHSNVDDGQTSQVERMGVGIYIECAPTAVFLNYFKAEWYTAEKAMEKGESPPAQVMVLWETSAEIDNLGFNVYRGPDVEGPWTKLNAELIPSKVPPGSPVGAAYEWPDSEVPGEQRVFYLLEDVDLSGVATQHGPVSPR